VVQGFRPDNPVAKIPKPKVPHKVIPTFNEKQINDMLSACHTSEYMTVRNTAILLLMLDTGIRRAEVIAMQIADIDWQNNTILIHGKGRKERRVPLSTETSLVLKKYLLYHNKEHPEMWLSEEGKPLKLGGLRMIFARLKDRANIKGVRCSPHTMRHTAAVMLLLNGMDMKSVQDIFGHADIKSTEIYAHTVQMQVALSQHQKASPVAHLKRRK
jgi:integrase/recombinase XerC/integrase/recombinase XerD